jgi:hypothetical protein
VAIRNPFDREHGVRLAIGLGLAIVFLIAVAVPASGLAGFYRRLDAMSAEVGRRDFEAAKRNIDEVASFYDRLRNVGLQWAADSYLFRDAFLHRAAYAYLVGEYDAVVRDLSERIDDPRASLLLANAKFRLAQKRYRAIEGGEAAAVAGRAAIVREVLDLINPDYERALRADVTNRFVFKWNYDLTSDAEAIRRALQSPPSAEAPGLEEMKLKGAGTPTRRRKG